MKLKHFAPIPTEIISQRGSRCAAKRESILISSKPPRVNLVISVSSIVYKGENGNVLGLTGTATDISDRKRSEAALQQAKDQLLAVDISNNSDRVDILPALDLLFWKCLLYFGCSDKTLHNLRKITEMERNSLTIIANLLEVKTLKMLQSVKN